MDLTKYSSKDLKDIIKYYNLHTHISGYSKMKKNDLVLVIRKFMHFIDNELQNKVVKVPLPQRKLTKKQEQLEKEFGELFS